MNGIKTINVFMCTNHKTIEVEEILQTFENIAKVATGSYGLLHVWDEYEDEDNFRVLVARKGVVEWKKDEYFSPNSIMIYDQN
jgi:predicted O-linked N-acetylglucosamine transferase (SPINDLY family)